MAEYRVYQYMIFSTANEENNQERINKVILSTLDPVSFYAYHGERESIKVNLLRTWICPGYTGGKKVYCDSPYKELYQLYQRENQNEEGGE